MIETFSKCHSQLTASLDETEQCLLSETMSKNAEIERLASDLASARSENAKLSKELASFRAQITQQQRACKPRSSRYNFESLESDLEDADSASVPSRLSTRDQSLLSAKRPRKRPREEEEQYNQDG